MVSEQTAADTFALLSDESRVEILRSIAIAQYEQGPSNSGFAPLSFSDIYERIDIDNTSKLSYHLGELTDTYLRKTDDGYSFTHAGEQIVRFILAENFRQPAEFEPIETEGTCLYCGETQLEAGLDDQYFMVRCPSCERPVTGYIVTPAQTRSYSGTALLDSLKRKQAVEFSLVQEGICPECAGRIRTDVLDASEQPIPEEVPVSYFTIAECEACLRRYSGPLTYSAAFRTPAVSFYWEQGVDIMGTGWWELHRYLTEGEWTAERIATDPAEYRVVLRHEDAALRVFLDDETRITRTERVHGRNID
ncbi:helix-turn-helix transcriptional regulator [Halorubrum sp. F4]|uniref:ArsR/SmtB family transcription factor n=1 Tax=Halorubrum sp. F4 TaxID=2989715 RepID=UPI0024814BB3|nr:helix-turn-helix domain-containing protein [Halorubrum sp. F4]